LNSVVFIGPTLRREDVAAVCDAVCLPPVAQGDVYRIAQHRPRAIGIVDGYFSGAPSVWHKEILWALSQGIHVFGSASMGALRAAELHSFGMRGVGRIFDAFRDGELEDDDEVAVIHGPAEAGFIPASEPMVNIRASLARAEHEGVLDHSTRRKFEESAKSLFFPRRTWAAVLEDAAIRGVSSRNAMRLRDWLPAGRVDQKRADALEMLSEMKVATVSADVPVAGFTFEWTSHWDAFVARTAHDTSTAEHSANSLHNSIIRELRLEGAESYARVRDRVLLRLLANRESNRLGLEPSPEVKRERLARLRAAQGLFNRSELDSWLQRNHLAPSDLERLIEDDARAQAALGPNKSLAEGQILDELRLTGAYERLAKRAEQKQYLLSKQAQDGADAVVSPPAMASLRLWFFEQRLGRPMPDDPHAFASDLGFSDMHQFDDAILGEWYFLHATRL
jgi:hypothetical protein